MLKSNLMEMDQKSILIVEDEGIVSIDIRNILNRLGYTVPAVAFTGAEAIQQSEEFNPDLILMDIGLKGEMDGIDAACLIKKKFGIPILFLTGFADDNTLQRAKSADPVGYVVKPINEKELQDTIEKVFVP
ncbi:MAG: response regulator [Candidatus Aminicenantes bacterium]|nr:response regulator [Candidatus Aminicenantes bacterium]